MSTSDNLAQEQSIIGWELKQLVRSGLYPDESSALRSALRALFQANPQARVRMVASAYQAGEIGLGKAAAILGVSQEEMKDILREVDAHIHLGPQTLEDLQQDARDA